jgi:hypothetical protein
MTNNPLIDKYFELYPEKKEPPKMPRIEDYEGEETIVDELKKSKSRKLTSYDPDDLKVSFHQVAEQIKNGEAQVVSMNMEMDTMGIHSAGAKITFEVYVHKF